jgi:hypothetical protein
MKPTPKLIGNFTLHFNTEMNNEVKILFLAPSLKMTMYDISQKKTHICGFPCDLTIKLIKHPLKISRGGSL